MDKLILDQMRRQLADQGVSREQHKAALNEFLAPSMVKDVLYRGTRRAPKAERFATQQGRATPSFTVDPEVANVYSKQLGWDIKHGPGSTSVPVHIQTLKPFDIRSLGEHVELDDVINLMDHDLTIPSHPGKLGYEDLADMLSTLDYHVEQGDAKKQIDLRDQRGLKVRSFERLAEEIRSAGRRGDVERILYELLPAASVDAYALGDSHNVVRQLKKQGFDSMIHKDVFDAGAPYYEGDINKLEAGTDSDYVVDTYRPFDQKKIKSAIGNRGSFDVSNPDITKAKGGSVPKKSNDGFINDAHRKWFGDSKIADEKGRPLVLYRGVQGSSAGALNAEPREGYNVFASSSPHVAASYGMPDELHGTAGSVMPIHVKAHKLIEFPVATDRYGSRRFDKFEFDRRAKTLGPGEALVARKVHDIGPMASEAYKVDPKKLYSYGSDVYAIGRGTSIKSAVGNRGTFDPSDPDITKADGGAVEDDYRGEHTAPGPHFGAPMHDVTRDMYPKDFYGPNGFRYYADYGEQKDRDAYNKVIRVKGKPNETVAIHRAIPTSVYKEALEKDSPLKHMIRKGDWVAINKDYAKEHGESVLKGDYKIATMRVPAKHVWTNGDSVHEWGYHPVEEKAKGGSVKPNLVEDIPNEDWLKSKVDYSLQKGRNSYGVPHMGSITGYYDKPVHVPLKVLSKLRGKLNEQENVRPESLDYIRKNWSEASKKHPYIEVAHNGEAWVSEGNHRIMVANEKGLDSMPVQIRYFDGGQRKDGPLHPSKISSQDNVEEKAKGGAVGRGDDMSEVVNHVPQKDVPAIGINVATDKDMRYADLIVDGKKQYESRNSDSLRPWVGRRVSIVRTGEGKAKAIGAATLGEPLVVDGAKFRAMQEQHLVPPGSKFDIKSGVKYLYPVKNPERFDKEHDVGHGIVARRVTPTMAEGGTPKKTVTAYKLFRVDPKHPGKLFPLFVNANKPVETGKWIDAEEGSKSKTGKVKSKLGDLAYRPGWHSGDVPIATHIGDKDEEQKAEAARIEELRKATAAKLGNDKKAKEAANKKHPYPDWVSAPRLRSPNHLWAEVSLPDDVNWQEEATKRGINKKGKVIAKNAHITDQIPKSGNYRYKTNPNMTGNWLISGSMKVNRVLPDEEVERINKEAGVKDLPREKPMDLKKFGFAQGGPTIDQMRYQLLKRKG